MEKSLVVYATRAGSSKVIAEKIADIIGCETVSVKSCKQSMIYAVDNVIFVGCIRMNYIYKYKKFAINMNLNSKHLITVAVGMTYPDTEFIKHVEEKNHHDNNADSYSFAYLQGAFDLQTVKSKLERFLMVKLAENVEGKDASYIKSESERNMLACVKAPHNFFRNHHVAPIVGLIDSELSARIPMTLQMEYDDDGVEIPAIRPCVLDMSVSDIELSDIELSDIDVCDTPVIDTDMSDIDVCDNHDDACQPE